MTEIPAYILIRANRRTISLSVSFDKGLVVRAPMRTPLSLIEKFIYDKKNWITATTAKIQARPKATKKQFTTGEIFLFLGKPFPLSITKEASQTLSFDGSFFLLKESKQSKGFELFTKWYKQQAQLFIERKTSEIAQNHDFSYKSVKISTATKRWGSCSAQGNLNFTWRLILAPETIIEYVICHELAHLKHHNHGSRFWAQVSVLYPKYKEARKWLKDNEHVIKL